MNIPQRIAFVGYRGTGKSTLGAAFAEKIGRAFVDTDAVVKRREKKTIEEIFSENGEPYFREREKDALRESLSLPSVVIATGGGVPLDEENRLLLKTNAFVIYLSLSPDVIVTRIEEGHDRPRLLLTAEDWRAEVRETLLKRVPLYESIADFFVDVTGKSPMECLEEILKQF